jgi:hypothetical protein
MLIDPVVLRTNTGNAAPPEADSRPMTTSPDASLRTVAITSADDRSAPPMRR